MARVFIGLGSNLGDRAGNIEAALAEITARKVAGVVRRSAIFETQAEGGPEQPLYCNAAAELATDLEPLELLQACKSIEAALGRKVRERWGPREIDIDLLLYDDQILHSPALTIPHPRMHLRMFVLEPLCEIAAKVSHPILRMQVEELLQRVRSIPAESL